MTIEVQFTIEVTGDLSDLAAPAVIESITTKMLHETFDGKDESTRTAVTYAKATVCNLIKDGYRLEPTASFQLDPEILEAYCYYDIQMYYNPSTNHYVIGTCNTGEFIQDAGCTQEGASKALTEYCIALLDAEKVKE